MTFNNLVLDRVINYKYETVYITKIRKDEFGAVLTFKDGSWD